MPTFVFKLDAVLRQRAQGEKQRQRDLATAQRRLAALHSKLAAAENALRDAAGEIREHSIGRIDPKMLAAGGRYMIAMREKAAGLRASLVESTREVKHAQVALTEAAKQRKVLE